MDIIPYLSQWSWNLDLFGLNPASYSLAIDIFIRLLGVIYIIAYVPFLFQIRGLVGREGIRPVADFLAGVRARFGNRRFYVLPTLLWFNTSDRALFVLIWSGILLGVLLMCGVYPPLILVLLYMVQLSLKSIGQEFLGFGWELLLMEATVALFLTVATTPLNIIGWVNLNFLLLRFHFQAGASKLLSGDKNWRNLTALWYHYFTQPLPNTTAWYFQKLPMWVHKGCCLIMFYSELVVPLFIFAPPIVRLLVFVQLLGLQLSIWFTGNLCYLNHFTIAYCVILLHNSFLEPFFGTPESATEVSPTLWYMFISILALGYLALQIVAALHPYVRSRLFYRTLSAVEPFHLAYSHGIFAVMTTKRHEIIVEGSYDGTNWHEYLFFYKPGDVSWRPRRISPYQPRVDWQAWFLPFSFFESQGWFQVFLIKLLQGSVPVIKLLKYNPFAEKAPLFVRALIYDYTFTTIEEKAKTGNWWKRTFIGEYAPPMRLPTSVE